jgi:hypothetical protein
MMGWISFIYAVVSVASILFSSKSCKVSSYIHPSCFHPRAARILSCIHPSCVIQDLEGFSYIHPYSFHQNVAGFSLASRHPLFIQKLVGFPLHPSILLFIYEPEGVHFTHPSSFSSTSWRVFHFIHPSSS